MPITAYCKKCARDVEVGERCPHCGGKLTKSAVRVAWCAEHYPVGDWMCWNAVMRLLLPVLRALKAGQSIREIGPTDGKDTQTIHRAHSTGQHAGTAHLVRNGRAFRQRGGLYPGGGHMLVRAAAAALGGQGQCRHGGQNEEIFQHRGIASQSLAPQTWLERLPGRCSPFTITARPFHTAQGSTARATAISPASCQVSLPGQ